MVNVLLVGGSSPFGLVLAKKLQAIGAKVYIYDTQEADLDDIEFVRGTLENAPLIRRVVSECKISRLFLLPKPTDDQDAAAVARRLLLGTTAMIEEVRRSHSTTGSLPQFIHIGQIAKDDEKFSAYKTAVLSVEAFLHSYAVSYRMDIRLVRLDEKILPKEFERLACRVLEISSLFSKEPAQIYNLESEYAEDFDIAQLSNHNEPNVRFLVYGANSWIGKQFLALLKEKGVGFDRAELNPCAESVEQIRNKVLDFRPSHVVFLGGRSGGSNRPEVDYDESGPEKLKENLCDNCFSPWCLANICEQSAVHFTFVGMKVEELEEVQKSMKENNPPVFKGSHYSAVKGFTDRLLQSFTHTLNAQIRLPTDEEQKGQKAHTFTLLSSLLNLILSQTVGTINLITSGTAKKTAT